MNLYAQLNKDGSFKEVIPQKDEIPPEVLEANNMVPYVEDPEVYDGATHKLIGREVVVIDGVAHKRAIIVAKDDDDRLEEALERRRDMLPPREESIELVIALLNRLIDWAVLQARPDDPSSVFRIMPEEVAALDRIEANLRAAPLPLTRRSTPIPIQKDQAR
ncbi:MAG: hypothetical protein AB7P12_03435 [Alphaproteobacteria bacterium]